MASLPLYDLLIYRAGDDRCWDARARFPRTFADDAAAWDRGDWTPNGTLLWSSRPEAEAIALDPEVRRRAAPPTAHYGRLLVATWSAGAGVTYPPGTADTHSRLADVDRHYIGVPNTVAASHD